ncbi:MAG: glycoside hydrolase family 113 [Acidimicrobiales bacterium]
MGVTAFSAGKAVPRLLRLIAVVLGATLAAQALAVAPAGARPDGTEGRVAGMAVTPSDLDQPVIDGELGHIRSIGINSVTVDVWWDVDGATQSHLSPGSLTAPDSQLISTIDRARANGLGVILVPKLWCPTCYPLSPTWVGKLQPRDRAEFFREYRGFILRYAALAQAHGVWLYAIGHEMNSLQGEAGQFRALAHAVRQRFHGKLIYGMDWSSLAGFGDQITFWDAVDVIGVSAYFPLSGESNPSVAQLEAGWHASAAPKWLGHRWFDALAALAQGTGRPVLFVEVGYVSTTHAAQDPGDPNRVYQTSQQSQLNAYQALLATFEEQPWWLGVVWWDWDLGSSDAATYTPRGKLAEQLITRWYRDALRPG